MSNITLAKVGDRVRSHDFGRDRPAGRKPCFVEGTVVARTERYGCPFVVIRVSRRVFNGKAVPFAGEFPGGECYAPQNGTPCFGSSNPVTDNIEVIE